MRCLARNKQKFYYALFNAKNESFDEDGCFTGEYTLQYGKPVKTFANISAAMGETAIRQFGEGIPYDKVIVMDDPHTVIDEYSILWIDKMPAINRDGTTDTPHDYVVKKVARSLNSVSIAVAKVDIG